MSHRSHTDFSKTENAPRSASSIAPAAIAALVNSIMLASSASAQSTDATMLLAAADTVQLDKFTVEDTRAKPIPSPKFTAAPVDTPQTISVISSDVFNQQAAVNLSDVLRNTPGITFTAGENGNVNTGDSFFMRGSDSSNAIFIDGVRDSGIYSRDVYNLDQVEIAKGPASDNGRANPGGYINLSTKTPHLESFQAGTLSYGFDETDADPRTRATLDVNEALSSSPVAGTAVRFNAMWQDGGVAGREIAENNRWAVAPSLALGLGTPTRAIVAFEHFEQNNLPEFGVPSPVVPDVVPTNFGGSIERDNFYGLRTDYDDVESNSVTVRLEHDLRPDLRLTNQTRYGFLQREALYTSFSAYNITPPNPTPATPVNASRQSNFRTNEILSNITNLSAEFTTGSIEHSAATGLELSRETAYTRRFTGLGTVAPADVFAPNPDRPLTGFAPERNGASEAQIDTVALYLFDTAKISEQWQITGGARLENYDTTLLDYAAAQTQKSTDDLIASGKIGLVFKPAANGSVYVAYGNSARPPLTNTLSPAASNTPGSTGAESPGAKEQRAEIYEVGTKWDLYAGKLSTTLALFSSKNKNVSIATDPGTGDPTAYGNTEVQGVELGITGNISKAWFVFGGFSYLDTQNNNPLSATANNADLQWTPRLSGNLWTTYAFASSFVIGGGVQYVDSVARQTTTNPSVNASRLPEYWVGSLMASYELTRNVTLRLNVENVTDELYARALNNGGGRVYLGAPRTFLLTADFKF
jgi:catecholate siderophore receptor